jgi:hypothetical protein
MNFKTLVTTPLLLLAPLAAAAQEASWPDAVVCSLRDATICTGEGCRQATLASLDVPEMIRLDLKAGEMHAVTPEHAGRRTTFRVVGQTTAKIVMQGYENGRAFSSVLAEGGTLAVTAAIENTTFSVLGRCTDLKLVTEPAK